MINVMKAQKYQLLRSISTYAVFLITVIFLCAVFLGEFASQDTTKLSGSLFVSYIGEICTVVFPMLILIYTALVFGSDLSDKTINYELLSGITRRDVFFGRFFVVLLLNTIIYIVLSLIPILIFTLRYGWGHSMTVNDAVLRYAAALFPLIRLTAFYSFLTFLLGNKAVVIAIGYVFSMVEMILVIMINELFNTKVAMYIFSYDLFSRLLAPQNMGYGFFDGEDVMVVKDILQKETAVHAVAAGVIGTAVFLILGSAAARRRDMN